MSKKVMIESARCSGCNAEGVSVGVNRTGERHVLPAEIDGMRLRRSLAAGKLKCKLCGGQVYFELSEVKS